jgi:hypothetical protein
MGITDNSDISAVKICQSSVFLVITPYGLLKVIRHLEGTT